MSILKGAPLNLPTLNATIHGATYNSSGGYLDFDGVNDYVELDGLVNSGWGATEFNNFAIEIDWDHEANYTNTIKLKSNNHSFILYNDFPVSGTDDFLYLKDNDDDIERGQFQPYVGTGRRLFRFEYVNGVSKVFLDGNELSVSYDNNENPSNFSDIISAYLMSNEGNNRFAQAKLYDFKLYNGNDLFVHYDLSATGAVVGNQLINQVSPPTPAIDNIYYGAPTQELDYSDLSNISYDNVFLSSSVDTTFHIHMIPDGTKLFFIKFDTDDLRFYDLSTPYNISSATLSSQSLNMGTSRPLSFNFNNDGTVLYVVEEVNSVVKSYQLPNPYDISSKTLLNTFTPNYTRGYDIDFSNDGIYMFLLHENNLVEKYQLSTPYSLSNVSTTNDTFTANAISDIEFSPDGLVLLVTDRSNANLPTIESYNLSSPYDITNVTFNNTFGANQTWQFYEGLEISLSGEKIYLLNQGTPNGIYQYSTNFPTFPIYPTIDRVYAGGTLVFGTPPPVTLGVEWDQDTDSLVRLDDAFGLTAGSDFDAFNHYKLRRCMVNDDLSINYYIDPDDPNLIGEVVNTGSYTTGGTANYTGSHGQVMVEIPKFWWKTDEPTSDQYQWRISDAAQTGYDVHPAFITDGVTKDYIYMSAFEGHWDGSSLASISNVKVATDNTSDFNTQAGPNLGSINDFRTYAQNRGTGWQIQTYWGIHALQMLYIIEYADFDTQTTIGKGRVEANFTTGPITTGETISLGNASGIASGTNGLSSISYRGVENLWGNTRKYIDGLNINNNVAYISNENFSSNTYSGNYTLIGTLSSTNGFISDILFPHFLPTENNGLSTSHLHDDYIQSTGEKVFVMGGYWRSFEKGGYYKLFMTDPSLGEITMGSRLQIL